MDRGLAVLQIFQFTFLVSKLSSLDWIALTWHFSSTATLLHKGLEYWECLRDHSILHWIRPGFAMLSSQMIVQACFSNSIMSPNSIHLRHKCQITIRQISRPRIRLYHFAIQAPLFDSIRYQTMNPILNSQISLELEFMASGSDSNACFLHPNHLWKLCSIRSHN